MFPQEKRISYQDNPERLVDAHKSKEAQPSDASYVSYVALCSHCSHTETRPSEKELQTNSRSRRLAVGLLWIVCFPSLALKILKLVQENVHILISLRFCFASYLAQATALQQCVYVFFGLETCRCLLHGKTVFFFTVDTWWQRRRMPRLADLEQMAYELFLCCTRMLEYARICKNMQEYARICENM